MLWANYAYEKVHGQCHMSKEAEKNLASLGQVCLPIKIYFISNRNYRLHKKFMQTSKAHLFIVEMYRLQKNCR